MKNKISLFLQRLGRLGRRKSKIIFKLHVDFGYRESSPIPYQKTGHNNLSAVVLAIPGTYGELFPGKRQESIRFLSYIEDDEGTPQGIRCIIREYSERLEEALDKLGIAQKYGIEQKPETELELYLDRRVIQEATDFNNGVTTTIYRKYRLERIEKEDKYRLVGNLWHEVKLNL